MTKLRYLNVALGLVLAFVGLEMLVADLLQVPISLSLLVIRGPLAASIAAPWLLPGPAPEE